MYDDETLADEVPQKRRFGIEIAVFIMLILLSLGWNNGSQQITCNQEAECFGFIFFAVRTTVTTPDISIILKDEWRNIWLANAR